MEAIIDANIMACIVHPYHHSKISDIYISTAQNQNFT